MIQKNKFTAQIVADLDPSKIQSNQWVFPTQNFRIFNKDGKGYIASIVNGNEEVFQLSDGFVITGACEYKGIAFIASHNTTTGKGEIGSYPSISSGSFVRTYSPLQNFIKTAISGNFRTTELNFDLSHIVDMMAKPSFDNSIDLYLCDHKNPNRVINSGFKLDGTLNTRTYDDNSFAGSINQQPYTIKDIRYVPSSTGVEIGGSLKPGNIYVFVRYMTEDYARTPFIKSIGPFCIANGLLAINILGEQEYNWITGSQNSTDKKIAIYLAGIDTSYDYFEFGILRYSALEENGPATPNAYLIDKRYKINWSNDQYYIYGNEPEALLTLDELIVPVNDYSICKSQVSVFSRWIGVNWKKQDKIYDRAMLALFAEKIVINQFEDATTFPNDPIGAEDYDPNTVNQQYQDVDKTQDKLGYFRDQIYPFGIVFKFSDGSESEAFPLKGKLGSDYNTKGLFKFQGWSATPDTQKIILGVSFKMDDAFAYFNGLSPANKQNGFNSVVGYYFVRGERIDNLICQGVMIRGFHSMSTNYPSLFGTYSFGVFPSSAYGTNNTYAPVDAAILPLFQGQYPIQRQDNDVDPVYYGNSQANGLGGDSAGFYLYGTHPTNNQFMNIIGGYAGAYLPYSNKYGIFSPDIILGNDINIQTDCYVNPIMRFMIDNEYNPGNNSNLITSDDNCMPSDYVLDLNESKATFDTNDYSLYQRVAATVVDKFQNRGELNFSSYTAGGEGIKLGDGNIKNRNIGLCKYIGVHDLSNRNLKETCSTPIAEQRLSIVNLYKGLNDTDFNDRTLSSFNVPTSVYYRMSDLKELTALSVLPTAETYSIYKGDCFLQKTWFRQARWYAMEDPNDKDDCGLVGYASSNLDPNCKWYQHGLMIGIITESKVNNALRNDVIAEDSDGASTKYTFFPKCLENGITVFDFAVNSAAQYLHEATQVNSGYSKILPDTGIYGYDSTEPIKTYDKPNRAYHSDPHIAGSFIDGWRTIQATQYRDYVPSDGAITRISKFMDYPFLIHEFAINQIYLDERATQSLDSGDVILASSETFLSDRIKQMASFGSQHFSSIIRGTIGIYGTDSIRGMMWKVGLASGKGGGFFLNAEDITLSKLIRKEFSDIFDEYSEDRDIIDQIPDTPLLGKGIVGFYNPDYKEVGMSIMLYKPSGERILKTFVFDELLAAYKGTYTFVEPFYFNIGTKLFSCQHYLQEELTKEAEFQEYKVNNKVFRYDAKGIFNNFFGQTATAKLSFIVNGLGAEGKDASDVEKKFNSMMIESTNKSFSRITFETLYQLSEYTFVSESGEFWMNSSYESNKWHIPIAIQTSIDEEQFDITSEMTGTYMLVTLEYNIDEEFDIRGIETDFTPLKS